MKSCMPRSNAVRMSKVMVTTHEVSLSLSLFWLITEEWEVINGHFYSTCFSCHA